MKVIVSKIAIILFFGFSGNSKLEINNEINLDFPINKHGIFNESIQMFCAFLDTDGSSVKCNYNNKVDFKDQMLPIDIHQYYKNKGDEEYYTLLTKTIYGINQDVSYFTEERLSSIDYLEEVMPDNEISKNGNNYELEIGFGAPDIFYTLEFHTNNELNSRYPELVAYFKKHDNLDLEPGISVFQHNHTFGKVMGQKTTKMSLSISRYFDAGKDQTLVINYTLSFIHNLPPPIFGGGNFILKQMREGVIALVKDTRDVCEDL